MKSAADILQVGLRRGQAAGGGDGILEAGMDAPVGADDLGEALHIGGGKLFVLAVLQDLADDGMVRDQLLQYVSVGGIAAFGLLFGGRLCMCNRPERLSDTIFAMKNNGIEPKRLRLVTKTPYTRPWLFLIEGRKGGKPFMNVDPLLIMYGEDGELSKEVTDIYGEYKENVK